MFSKNQTILGIDPGYGRVGIAVIEKSNRGEKLIYSECFETDGKLSHLKRLLLIGEKVRKVIEKYQQIKLAITRYGKSDKKQIISMVEKLIKISPSAEGQKRHDDEYDAIAAALTCAAISLSTGMLV